MDQKLASGEEIVVKVQVFKRERYLCKFFFLAFVIGLSLCLCIIFLNVYIIIEIKGCLNDKNL